MFFDIIKSFRLRPEENKSLKEICKFLDDRYDNESHFIRCAVIKLINGEQKNVRRIKEFRAKTK